MSQAAPYAPAEPNPTGAGPRRTRTRLLLIPLGVIAVLIAIPGGTYVFAANQLSQAQSSESAGRYSQALEGYATVESIAGNPLGRPLLGDLNDHALIGTAETHLLWGVQLKEQGKFAESEMQLRAVAQSGLTDWAAKGNAALAGLFIAWGQSLVAKQQFQACLLYTSPSPRDLSTSRMPSSA